jgi:hypothetical protein
MASRFLFPTRPFFVSDSAAPLWSGPSPTWAYRGARNWTPSRWTRCSSGAAPTRGSKTCGRRRPSLQGARWSMDMCVLFLHACLHIARMCAHFVYILRTITRSLEHSCPSCVTGGAERESSYGGSWLRSRESAGSGLRE